MRRSAEERRQQIEHAAQRAKEEAIRAKQRLRRGENQKIGTASVLKAPSNPQLHRPTAGAGRGRGGAMDVSPRTVSSTATGATTATSSTNGARRMPSDAELFAQSVRAAGISASQQQDAVRSGLKGSMSLERSNRKPSESRGQDIQYSTPTRPSGPPAKGGVFKKFRLRPAQPPQQSNGRTNAPVDPGGTAQSGFSWTAG